MASNQDPNLTATITGASNTSRVVPTSAGLKDTGAVTHKEIQTATNRKSPAKRDTNLDEIPIWKKAVIGGVAVLLTVAAAARLRKSDKEGNLDGIKDNTHKKGDKVQSAVKGAVQVAESKTKEVGSSSRDKFGDVLDVTGDAAKVSVKATGNKLDSAKEAVKESALETTEFLQQKRADAKKESDKKMHEAEHEARRLADKNSKEDDGFLGSKKWFK